MLRAHATDVGAWEKFQFCYDKRTTFWSILSDANGRWAVTQLDYPGLVDKYMLRANATGIGLWEQYRIFCITGGNGAFEIESAASDRYVAAELGFKGKTMACCVLGQTRWARGRSSFPSPPVSDSCAQFV
jgi:hypothetical protein